MMSRIDGRKEECKYLLNCSLGYGLEVENVCCFTVPLYVLCPLSPVTVLDGFV
jgi:hypothetical protein